MSKNYGELNDEGREALLKIGEKVFIMNNFVNRKITSFSKYNKKEKFENEQDD
ncbi:MAG: hypothetical protein LBS37_11055 [Treponema sp.]|nr:hypothetical protein [Treponema sp.]